MVDRLAFTICPVFAGFLRKVYGILTAQLALTIIVAGIFMYTESIKGFVQAR